MSARRRAREAVAPQPTVGSVAPYVNDKQVDGLAGVTTQNGQFALCEEGLNVGRDGASPVTWDHPGKRPLPFTSGTIRRVVVNVSGESYLDLEKEAMAVPSRE